MSWFVVCGNIFTSLHRHILLVGDGAFSHEIDDGKYFYEIINVEGHLNRFTGSRVTAILLNGWILPIGGASAAEGLLSTGLPCLVYTATAILDILMLSSRLGLFPSVSLFSNTIQCRIYLTYTDG